MNLDCSTNQKASCCCVRPSYPQWGLHLTPGWSWRRSEGRWAPDWMPAPASGLLSSEPRWCWCLRSKIGQIKPLTTSSQSEQTFLGSGFPHTSVGFDVPDVFLGVCDLNGRAGDQLLAPAAHVVVEVDDAEVVVDGQVVQDGLHGLHRLWILRIFRELLTVLMLPEI